MNIRFHFYPCFMCCHNTRVIHTSRCSIRHINNINPVANP